MSGQLLHRERFRPEPERHHRGTAILPTIQHIQVLDPAVNDPVLIPVVDPSASKMSGGGGGGFGYWPWSAIKRIDVSPSDGKPIDL